MESVNLLNLFITNSHYIFLKGTRMKTSTISTVILVCLFCFIETASAQQAIVLDGLGGLRGRFMQPEVDRLTNSGYDVTYRPWWRWRNAVRTTPGATRVIGFSMGAPRAIQASRATGATQLELVDPVSINVMQAPVGTNTTVYRASVPSRINSTRVIGNYQQFSVPASHLGVPAVFRN